MNIAVNTLGYTACSDCSTIYNVRKIVEVNKADAFEFTVLPEDPLYSVLKTNKCSYIIACDENENESGVAFRGRVTNLSPKTSDTTSEMAVSCEGPLGYLKDSICWGTYVNSSREDSLHNAQEQKTHFMSIMGPLIYSHNYQVAPELQFSISWSEPQNAVSDSDKGYLTKSHSFDGVNTLDVLLEILEDLDWECMVTYSASTPHWTLHMTKRFGFYVSDPIVSGINLKSLNGDIDGTDLVTRVVPLGGVGYDEKRLMLNNTWLGGPLIRSSDEAPDYIINPSTNEYNAAYVDNDDLVSKWGPRIGVEIFDDIVANSEEEVKDKRPILRNKALEYVRKLSDVKTSFAATAYELNYTDDEYSKLQLHNYYTIRDNIGDMTVQARLTKKEINYDNKLESESEFTVDSSDSGAKVT